MKFCGKCGNMLIPRGGKLVCNNCGTEEKGKLSLSEVQKEKERIIMEEKTNQMPIIKAECPKCKCLKAYFWTVQTRAADEPPTKFFRCVKCENTWRDYS